MEKETRCAFCGKTFDVTTVRAAFNVKYAGRLSYDGKWPGKTCFACSCLMADRGLWREDTEDASEELHQGVFPEAELFRPA